MSIFDSISKAANKWLDNLEGRNPDIMIEQEIEKKKSEWKLYLKETQDLDNQIEKLRLEQMNAEDAHERLDKKRAKPGKDDDPEELKAEAEAYQVLIEELQNKMDVLNDQEEELRQKTEKCAAEIQRLKRKKEQVKLENAEETDADKQIITNPLDKAREKIREIKEKRSSKTTPADRAKERLQQLKSKRTTKKEKTSSDSEIPKTKPRKTL